LFTVRENAELRYETKGQQYEIAKSASTTKQLAVYQAKNDNGLLLYGLRPNQLSWECSGIIIMTIAEKHRDKKITDR